MGKWVIAMALTAILSGMWTAKDTSKEDRAALVAKWEQYQMDFDAIKEMGDLEQFGYEPIEEQSFPVLLKSFGKEEVLFVPAIQKEYGRLGIFLMDQKGKVLFKTRSLSANMVYTGQLDQPVKGIAAVSFQDVDKDGLEDILLIISCENETGNYVGESYKIGDVLYQGKKTFYRDYRISDKINRFDMNKSIKLMKAYAVDGISTEFLYTSQTLKELLEHGFEIIEEQCYYRYFEKLGRLRVVPGVFNVAEYHIFMIYLVNEEGDIVWNFQSMGDYDSLYSLKGITGRDLDADGLKDLAVLAKYSYEGPAGELLVDTVCAVYYQRTGGFETDTEFVEEYTCTEDETLEHVVKMVREFWGWSYE